VVKEKNKMEVKILRGISGSGKSTLAKKIKANAEAGGDNAIICSADDFFVDDNGSYIFDPKCLPQAHAWCMGKFRAALEFGCDLIIVDNTNIQKWHYQRYLDFAAKAGAEVEVVVVGDPKDWMSIRNRNVHGVPANTLQHQSESFEV
jgi:predicted kinase